MLLVECPEGHWNVIEVPLFSGVISDGVVGSFQPLSERPVQVPLTSNDLGVERTGRLELTFAGKAGLSEALRAGMREGGRHGNH